MLTLANPQSFQNYFVNYIQMMFLSGQATEEFHSRIAAGGAGRGAQLATPAAAELLDDAELLVDDREIDADLTGESHKQFTTELRLRITMLHISTVEKLMLMTENLLKCSHR